MTELLLSADGPRTSER